MLNKIKFSVLSYFPSVVANENINVGILYHNITADYRKFHIMKNWSRLESFDDELDIDFMKVYLTGIRDEVEQKITDKIDKIFEIENYTKFYVNELRFSDILEYETHDPDTFINNTNKVYMRLDYEKQERLTRKDEVGYIKNLMRGNKINYSSHSIKGQYSEDVAYDYIVHDYAFKNFAFENKKMNRLINSAKAWSYNAHAMRKQNIKTVFVYDMDRVDSEHFEIVLKILKENAQDVIKTVDVINYATKIETTHCGQQELDLIALQPRS